MGQGAALDGLKRRITDAIAASPSLTPVSDDLAARTAPLDIIIPVFNNAALLQRCLESLRPTLGEGDVVWLVDDASHEDEVARLFKRFSRQWRATRIIRNARNLGFVRSSNLAFERSGEDGRRDLVLLNSDTEVTAGWLEHLQSCLVRNPRAGIVCPLSDNATILSVVPPRAAQGNASQRTRDCSSTGDVVLPTAVGFCMLMRRDMLDQVGAFSLAFSPGYGEENDLSMRALAAGWDILAADRACVYHHSGGSFGSEQRNRLQREHGARLERIWPEYAPLVQSWWRDNPLRVRTEQLACQQSEHPRVLHVLHRQYQVGGTERVARTLIRALDDQYHHTLVYPGDTANAWCDLETQATEPLRELMLNKRWIRPGVRVGGHGADLTCAQTERALARLLEGGLPAIVHFHHMLHWDSLLLPVLAREMGCRVVISVHDFWFNCAIHNQLEHSTGQPCGRPRAMPDKRCQQCLCAYGIEPSRSDAYVQSRNALVGAILAEADAVIVPSQFIREKVATAFGLEDSTRLHVQPHGVALADARLAKVARSEDDPVVLGFFGGDQVMKGANLVLQLGQALAGRNVEFRVYGRIKGFDPAGVPPNVKLCGFYNPDDVGKVLAGVDLALLPSFYEESFSMIASECWANGVPVLSASRGAMAERVVEGVNGWTVGDMSSSSWVHRVNEVLDGDRLQRCREALAGYKVTTIEESASTLDALYQRLLADHGKQRVQGTAVKEAPVPRHFSQRLAALRGHKEARSSRSPQRLLGVVRDHWGTPAYRVCLPLRSLAASGHAEIATFHVVRESGFDLTRGLEASGAGRVVVQPFLSDVGLQLMEYLHRLPGVHTTLVIDDLWTAMRPDNPALAASPPDIGERLAYAASLSQSLVLTTRTLREQLGLEHDNVHVINNALPEDTWGPLHSLIQSSRAGKGKRLRIGWVGAPQHGEDLAFLGPVIEATGDLADWVFLGMCPPHLRPLAAEVHEMVPFEDYPTKLAGLGLDLGVAPLADHAFNRCKSHLKVLEYGILGIPVVAADLEPYRHCPVPLAQPDNVEAWVSMILELLQNTGRRLELGASLRRWVLAENLLQHRHTQWVTALGLSPRKENNAD